MEVINNLIGSPSRSDPLAFSKSESVIAADASELLDLLLHGTPDL
jgi:hypothetical protein